MILDDFANPKWIADGFLKNSVDMFKNNVLALVAWSVVKSESFLLFSNKLEL